MSVSGDQGSGTGLDPFYRSVVDEVSRLLTVPAAQVDREAAGAQRDRIVVVLRSLNERAHAGDLDAFYLQQQLLARIYSLFTSIPDGPTAEGSVLIHEVTRLLESATTDAEDAHLTPGLIDEAPEEPREYLSWLKNLARTHRVFKHPYYVEFIQHQATEQDLRAYVIQESVVDSRFDDLLAMMQVGTSGPAKMEIASNFWDEMGNGEPDQVHTELFNRIFEVFDITDDELESGLTASALQSGNLAVLLCRYRQLYPEAIGFLGMTEWLVPDRFTSVVKAWTRLGLPEVGIVYHRLHITVDAQHAAGWFHNVVLPSATSPAMRRGMARGVLWRLNSSARYLDERLAGAALAQPASPVRPPVLTSASGAGR